VENNRITHVWISPPSNPETTKLANDDRATKPDIINWTLYHEVLRVVKSAYTKDVEILFHYSNYSKIEDGLGLGVGSVSSMESWSERIKQ